MNIRNHRNSIRIFQISHELFWGYRLQINLQTINSYDDAINLIREDLIRFFQSRNLELLVQKLNEINFHVHQPNRPFELWHETDINDIFYVCENHQ